MTPSGLKPPVYPSEEDQRKKARQVDFKSLEDQAKEWAKVRQKSSDRSR